jgi:hypothetical protein
LRRLFGSPSEEHGGVDQEGEEPDLQAAKRPEDERIRDGAEDHRETRRRLATAGATDEAPNEPEVRDEETRRGYRHPQ